ncbi:PEP/pyruvate-binding domain-containing protein [Sorangium sp. So ce1182]|uniref:PEP/pyruvate-binding domain-containing protein n=1 Tax=Sorangium sp. So ce1182 TaxID=3133334 RepID=UPI003F62FF4D
MTTWYRRLLGDPLGRQRRVADLPAAATSASRFIRHLRALGRGDLAVAGGKGANLGEMIRAGFPVPDGFVVTTAAYDDVVLKSGLVEAVARPLDAAHPGSEALRRAIESVALPDDLARAIVAAHEQLGRGPVAVRSSATAEDLPHAAFAGQQDTFLNVLDPAALLAAVRRCWASLWTDRAVAYRARQGIDPQGVQLAVVVQRMAPADVAGVLFTANPVTGARDEIVIDASPGLGEAVVSGLATPDHYVLRRSHVGLRIVARRRGRREVVVRPRAEGGTEQVSASGDEAPGPVLPDGTLRALARLGTAVARHFGGPQDIEWAVVSGTPWLLQARPITTLPAHAPHRPTKQEAFASMFADMLAVRPYPMDLTTWGPGLYGAVLRASAHFGLAGLPFARMFVEDDSVILRLRDDARYRLTPRVLLAPAYLLGYCACYDPRRWRDLSTIPAAEARVRDLEAHDLQKLSWEALIAMVHEAVALPEPLLGVPRRRYGPRAMVAVGLLRAVLWLVQHDDQLDVLQSGVETHTLAAHRALEELAAQVRGDPALAELFARHEADVLADALQASAAGGDFLRTLHSFLDCYGHRETAIFAVLEPTWKDAPEVVLGLLKGLAAAPPRPGPSRPPWEVARDELLTLRPLKPAPLRAAFLRILAEARCFTGIREDTHFYSTLPMPILRRTLLELGRRLAGVDVLDIPADIFHLRLDEVERVTGAWPPAPALAAALRSSMERRRARRAALADTPVVDPRRAHRHDTPADVLVRGTPGSPGVAEGPVRVIRDGAEFGTLRPGDVLVAPLTTPAWTPLFQRAAAVVVDSGGASSHAAIVAREYGIPAVMGAGDGTRRLKDGDPVRVDGNRGVVLARVTVQRDR